MKFNSIAELHLYIGRCGHFKKKIELKDCLSHLNNDSTKISSFLFSIKIHPNGFSLINKNGELFGFRFNEVEHYSLKRVAEKEMHIVLHLKQSEVLVYRIEPQSFSTLIILLRSLPIHFFKDNRDSTTIKLEINELSKEFALPNKQEPFSINLLDTSTFGNVLTLFIDKEEIHYKDKLIKIEDAIGFSYGVTVNRAYGATVSKNYEIIIHTKDNNPLNISFSKEAGLNNTPQQDQTAFSSIINVLFDLISRTFVVEWIDKFAQSQVIEYKDISISREGILVKKGKQPILMFWDEIIVQPQLVRWKYNNTVFVEIDGYYDRRTVMLMRFLDWILEDKTRLIKLLGTSILVSNDIEENGLLQ